MCGSWSNRNYTFISPIINSKVHCKTLYVCNNPALGFSIPAAGEFGTGNFDDFNLLLCGKDGSKTGEREGNILGIDDLFGLSVWLLLGVLDLVGSSVGFLLGLRLSQ